MPYLIIHRYKSSLLQCGPVALLVALLLFTACTAPEGPDSTPVKTEFEWTIDTVRYEGTTQFCFEHLAVTGAGRVYASAYSDASDNGGTFWEFIDGKWRSIPIDQRSGGQILGRVHQVHGLHAARDASLVWLVGGMSSPDPATGQWKHHGYLASHDGARFSNLDLFDVAATSCVYALRDDLVYFGSLDDSALFRYDGNGIKRYPLPLGELSGLSEDGITRISVESIAGSDRELVLMVTIHYAPPARFETVYLVLEDRSTWTVGIPIVSGSGREPSSGLWTSPDGDVYACEELSVFRFESGSWVQIYESPLVTFNDIWGVSDRAFWVSGFNTLYHFTESATAVPHLPIPNRPGPKAHVNWLRGWTDGREVFAIGQPSIESDIALIARGK